MRRNWTKDKEREAKKLFWFYLVPLLFFVFLMLPITFSLSFIRRDIEEEW